MNYECDLGLYHHKPVKDGRPSSNNGWIYTAFAYEMNMPVNMPKLIDLAKECIYFSPEVLESFSLTRLPATIKANVPPISRDEIIGMISLRVLHPKELLKRK